jgi:nicotinic acid mononucleotide adenylyltransferase
MSINTENTIIIGIGRMNPPTPGHILIFKDMINMALTNNVTQINFILSSTEDRTRNPLNCDRKRELLLNTTSYAIIDTVKEQMIAENTTNQEQIKNMKVNIICSPRTKSPIPDAFYKILREYGYPREGIKIILVIGKDRENEFNWLVKNKNPPIEMEQYILERSPEDISATEIRNYAINDNKEDFLAKMNETGLSNEKIENLFYEIQTILPKKGEEDEKPAKRRRKTGGNKKVRKTNKRKIKKSKKRKSKKRKSRKSKKLINSYFLI